jgi:hypothetical protein
MKATLHLWLLANPTLRLATERDCACAEDIKHERTIGNFGKAVPGYEPYTLVGDFRHNSQKDFAVVVTDVSAREHPKAYVLIFDGPFDAGQEVLLTLETPKWGLAVASLTFMGKMLSADRLV